MPNKILKEIGSTINQVDNSYSNIIKMQHHLSLVIIKVDDI